MTEGEKRLARKLNFYFKDVLDYFDLTQYIVYEDEAEIRMPCPVHGGDNPTGFCFDKSYLRWRCFTGGCHNDHGVEVFGLIKGIESCSNKEGLDIARKILSMSKRDKNTKHIRQEKKKDQNAFQIRSTERMDSQLLLERGINKKVLKKYLVGIYPSINPNRVLVPIITRSGKVVGASGRKIRGDGPKWMHIPKGISTDQNLFNINFVEPKNSTVILVEGPIDVLKLESANIHNSLAIFGSSLTDGQRQLLDELKIENIVLAFDNDKAGEKATKTIGRILKEHSYNVKRLYFDEKYKDIGEMPLFLLRRKKFEIKEI